MDHEMLAIMEALKHWQPYIHGKEFVVCTDHQPLMYFSHNQIFPLANFDGLKILLIYFCGVVFSTLRDP